MRRLIAGVGLLGMLAAVTSVDGAVLTFDEMQTDSYAAIPDGYGGFDWDYFSWVKVTHYSSSGYNNGVVSSDNVAYGWHDRVATVRRDTPFTFNGAYLTAAWNNGLSVVVKGFVGPTRTNMRTVTVDTDGPTWFAFNFTGLDSLTFESFGGTNAGFPVATWGDDGTHFAMDNFTYDESGRVPEPASLVIWSLIGLSCIGAGWFRRRKAA